MNDDFQVGFVFMCEISVKIDFSGFVFFDKMKFCSVLCVDIINDVMVLLLEFFVKENSYGVCVVEGLNN